jgi:hypothetical protein
MQEDLPPTVSQIVEDNYDDEQQHLEWIRLAIASRSWETGVESTTYP